MIRMLLCFCLSAHGLRREAGYHPGEDVPGASSRHPRIAGSVHPYGTIMVSDHGVTSFQNDDAVVSAGKIACDFYTVLLYVSGCESSKPGHLSGVGRDDKRTITPV